MSIARARSLRRKMSPSEARLWVALRQEPFNAMHFRRQVPFDRYYADFASHTVKLVVEVDGSQHTTDVAIAYDAQRDRFLRSIGYRVLRVSASDVLNRIESVMDTVWGLSQGL